MGATRDLVLKILLNNQRITIKELADEVNINPISVRHHITKLEASGLVESVEERHGVGRPRRVYFLTESGTEQFPSRYLQLSARLIEKLKTTLSPKMITDLFTNLGSEIVEDHIDMEILQSLEIEDRLKIAKNILEDEGFTVEIEYLEDGILIKEISCPFPHVSMTHSEICCLDRSIISTVLNIPAEDRHRRQEGDVFCSHFIPTINANDIQILEN